MGNADVILSRRGVLVLSTLAAAACYAGLLVAAPHLVILKSNTAVPEVERLLSVELRREAPPPPPPRDVAPPRPVERPGSIEELLEPEQEELTPAESVLDKAVAVPNLGERIGADMPERTHEVVPDAAALKKVDARILEIAEETARKDIEVARRFVRPSPTRILGEDEYPTLRGPGGPGEDIALFESALGSSVGRGGAAGGADAGETKGEGPADKPPYEEGVLLPGFEERDLPQPLAEEMVARAPVVEEARRESRYELMDELVRINVETYRPSDERLGYFRLRIVPKSGEQIDILPKDVTFVIDASSSILQRKLDETVEGIRGIIDSLRPNDRFNVVVFRDTPRPFRPAPVLASPDAKASARDFLEGLESRGETDVYRGILPVLDTPPRPGAVGLVVVMTDGRPTAGVRDGRAIINGLTAKNTERTTVLAFAGGRRVNRYLLDLLAYRNKGESFVSSEVEDMDRDLSAFFSRNSDPILAGLQADYGRIDDVEVFPKELPAFYKDRVVTVYGRFDPARDREFAMRLTGIAGDKEKEVVFRADLTQATTGDREIARQWAFEKSYYLIGEMCRVGETPELMGELQHLSRRYGIQTSYTE